MYKKVEYCLECDYILTPNVSSWSISNYGIPLCKNCQKWVQQINKISTIPALRIYFALKQRGINPEIEKFDGYKHIDIAIPKAKINIEIDGIHHNYDTTQAFRDLQRTFFSLKKGYVTIRIPNSLTYNDYVLNETANMLSELIYNEINKREVY